MIYKARRIMEIWQGGVLRLRLPIALGREPIGPKRLQGDGRTPEGEYRACTRNENSKYHRSIGINYPNRADAVRARAQGVLSEEHYHSIISALDAGLRPPWDTALGGEIMIHGGGISTDWTAGCIALTDEDMDLVWEMVPIGTEITIHP